MFTILAGMLISIIWGVITFKSIQLFLRTRKGKKDGTLDSDAIVKNYKKIFWCLAGSSVGLNMLTILLHQITK